jgi:hypothetical protein
MVSATISTIFNPQTVGYPINPPIMVGIKHKAAIIPLERPRPLGKQIAVNVEINITVILQHRLDPN